MLNLKEVVKLAVGPFSIDKILEGIDNFLDGNDFLVSFLDGLVDDSVRALSNFIGDFELPVDLIFKLFCLFHCYKLN